MSAQIMMQNEDDIETSDIEGILDALNELSSDISNFGLGVVKASGNIDHIVERSKSDKKVFGRFMDQIADLQGITDQIAKAVKNSTSVARDANQEMQASQTTVSETITKLNVLIEAVESIEKQMSEMTSSLDSVGNIAGVIKGIAQQTNLLALNATIEAARAGEAGKGFSVVASEVKVLATSTSDATSQIEETVAEIRQGFAQLSEHSVSAANTANEVESQAGEVTELLKSSSSSLQEVDVSTNQISDRMDNVLGVCGEILESADIVSSNVHETCRSLTEISHDMRGACDQGDALVVMAHDRGAEFADGDMIDLVKRLAHQVSELFETSVASGRISLDDLFDRNYQEITGTDPVQYMTRFTEFTDEVLPAIQERVLENNESVIFCAAVDDKAYLPTHNKKFSQPQGDDPVWNTANCRNRRIFDDPTGSRAGSNEKPVLLQTYLRDMGGGNFVVMKDVSAPIMVKGRHWGGFRIGYKS